MLEVFNRDLRKIAILENALGISDEENLNAISYFNFSLPYNDAKNKYCNPFYFVRLDDGPFYRIMVNNLERDEKGFQTYRCEHAIATLIDKVLFGYHVVGGKGYYTNEVIQYLLNQQLVRHWTLGSCEFNRQFEYGWEQENLLSALFSIPNCFTEDYIWDFDFNSYPWKISLKKLNKAGKPNLYVRNNRNLQSLNVVSDPTSLCTRLYPLGYGEGINQLSIASVNNGVKYIQSPKEYIDKYGIIEKVWTDRRYEDAESLLAAAKAMLLELQEPAMQNSVTFDEIGISSFEQVKLGGIVQIIDTETDTNIKTYITGINRDYDDVLKSKITVANKAVDIASTIADLADRQRIEMTYAQGATNLYGQSLQGNASKTNGLKVNFFIPAEMRIVNKVQAKVSIDRFRAYSKATEDGGGFFGTTEDGGGIHTTTKAGGGFHGTTEDGGGFFGTTEAGGGYFGTTEDGGGFFGTTEDGGGFYGTTEAGGGIHTTTETGVSAEWTDTQYWTDGWSDGEPINIYPDGGRNHGIPTGTGLVTNVDVDEDGNVSMSKVWFVAGTDHDHFASIRNHKHIIADSGHDHEVEIKAHSHDVEIDNHSHDVEIDAHSHSVEIEAHSHDVEIDDHSHDVEINDHSHDVEIKDHSHDVEIDDHVHDITPGIFEFGNPSSFTVYVNGTKRTTVQSKSGDLDLTAYLVQDGSIPRGVWHEIEIRPNDLAYISIDMFVQGFIQSRGDSTV